MVHVIDAGTDFRNKFERSMWQLDSQRRNKVVFNINRLYEGRKKRKIIVKCQYTIFTF